MFNWLKKKSPRKPTDTEPLVEPAADAAADSAVGPDAESTSELMSELMPEMIPDASPDTPFEAAPADITSSKPAASQTDTPEAAPPESAPAEKKESGGFFKRLKQGLTRTRQVLNTNVSDLFKGRTVLDDELLEELEELLITADIGVPPTQVIMARIQKRAAEIRSAPALQKVLKEEVLHLLADCEAPPAETKPLPDTRKPCVVMVVGVNGVGKTTTIGKLAALWGKQNQKVLIAAADTFRAAAVEQLTTWAERAGAELVKHKPETDPAAVAFDGVAAAQARGMDVAIIDTAGRLHTKVNLMEELKKIQRAISKKFPEAPHEVLLVLDATTGQNAVSQARLFHEALGVTGLVLTKLDGTAKGGIVISICQTLQVPLKYIGVGEQIDDLQVFRAREFVEAMF